MTLARPLALLLCLSATVPAFGQEPPRFPQADVLPRRETGALRLLEKHPEYDGRGVIVAIFDTGVDPGVAALQTTTDGKPKIIDLVDGTGSGDVVTTTVKTAKENTLEGLTGRKLKVPADWKNPTGKYHLGWKAGYEFLPGGVTARLKTERREEFAQKQEKLEEQLQAAITKYEQQYPDPKPAQKKKLNDLKARLEAARFAWKNYEDPGPVYDCVVFHDGEHWRAVVDTDQDGDLGDEKPLTNFRTERQYATFAQNMQVNFAVNVYDKGKLLSLVMDEGMHGTHVAGIVAAYYPQQPERNGVAPGAQIVSVKIGDSRIGGMENNAGLIRGLNAVLANQCDLVNMSYGEPTSAPNRGYLTEMFTELVDKHGVIFISSAGNGGPALSTVSAPGGTTEAIWGIGAYVSPEMMTSQYALPPRDHGLPYSWTSRGPTADGAQGVDFFAPGGAVAPVPLSTLRASEQANGTSMASPNACGSVALLLSGLKQNKLKYTPASVRKALEFSAVPLEQLSVHDQGVGLIQVDAAWEYLGTHKADQAELLAWQVRLSDGSRGLYLRDSRALPAVFSRDVVVEPHWPEKSAAALKIKLEQPVSLRSSVDWITTGQHLLLNSTSQTFPLTVRTAGLEPGVHTAEVTGMRDGKTDRAVLFRLPVTVIVPVEEAWSHELTLTCEPGHHTRTFLPIPAGAAWAEFTLTKQPTDAAAAEDTYVLHTLQVVPGQTPQDGSFEDYIDLTDGDKITRQVAVEPGQMLEFCFGSYWSSLHTTEVACEVRFHGFQPGSANVQISPARPTRVQITNLQPIPETAQPYAELLHHRRPLRPTEAKLRTLTAERDRLINGELASELVLTYEFELSEAASVTIHVPANENLVYESTPGPHLSMLFDANKRLIATDDIFPEAVSLEKGKYTLRLQFRQTDEALLKQWQETLVYLDRELSDAVKVRLAASWADALRGRSTQIEQLLRPDEMLTFWLLPPDLDDSDYQAGDLLIGEIGYGKENHTRPGGWPLAVQIPAPPEASDDDSDAEDDEDSNIETQADWDKQRQEQFYELLEELGEPSQDKLFESLATEWEKDHPNDRKLLLIRLHRLDTEDRREEHLPEIVKLADAVIATIKTEEIAAKLGRRGVGDKAARKQAVKDRDLLADTLYRKGRALGYMELPEVIEKHPIADQAAHDKAFEANFAELRKWVKTTDEKWFLLHIRREKRLGHYGLALKVLHQYLPETHPPKYWHYEKRADTFEALGWKFWEDNQRAWILRMFPAEYPPF